VAEDLRLIVHAGMGKAGSTALQLWLGDQAAELGELGIVSLRTSETQGTGNGWERVESGGAQSMGRPHSGRSDAFAAHGPFLQSIIGLGASAEKVVVSVEGPYDRLYTGDAALRGWLDAVAARVTPQIVIYVRPQHEWAEAAWRQWGFRTAMPASEWITSHADHGYLDYRWHTRLGERLDGMTLRLHPVVDGPSGRTDVVEHFATAILGLPPAHPSIRSGPQKANAGLSLRVCAALWRDPPTGLWIDQHDNLRLDALKLLLDERLRRIDGSDPSTGEIRRVLYDWAAERFGAANDGLLGEMGWDPEGWPVSSDARGAGAGLDAIDRLLERELAPADAAALAGHVERLVALPDEDVATLIWELRDAPAGPPDRPGGPDAGGRKADRQGVIARQRGGGDQDRPDAGCAGPSARQHPASWQRRLRSRISQGTVRWSRRLGRG
jgi:hypothetical protein